MLKEHMCEGAVEAGCDEAGRGCLCGSGELRGGDSAGWIQMR